MTLSILFCVYNSIMEKILLIILIMVVIIWGLWWLLGWWRCKGDVIEGLDTMAGLLSVDDQYFYDKLFQNVVYVPNSPEMTGWVKCNQMKTMGSSCVEYGITGNAYLFNPI
jgi:hypothetical protein